MDPWQNHGQNRPSYLFLIRLWKEDAAELGAAEVREVREVIDLKPMEWQGRVQQVLSGEVHPFQGWPSLIDLLLEMMETEPLGSGAPRSDESNDPEGNTGAAISGTGERWTENGR